LVLEEVEEWAAEEKDFAVAETWEALDLECRLLLVSVLSAA
jgi:hypothetical protein